jgi:hypothetical protein
MLSELLKSDYQYTTKKFKENYLYYVNNYDDLKERYKGKFIAIENGVVIDEDSNELELIRRLQQKGDFRHIFIQYINDQNNTYRI